MLGRLVSLPANTTPFLPMPCYTFWLLPQRLAETSAMTLDRIVGPLLTSHSPTVSQPSAVVSSLKKDANAAPTAASAVPTAARAIPHSLALEEKCRSQTARCGWIWHIRLDNVNGWGFEGRCGISACWLACGRVSASRIVVLTLLPTFFSDTHCLQ